MSGYYIGLMSGTSMDAVDAAIVDFDAPNLNVLAYQQYPIAADIRQRVRQVDLATDIEEISELDSLLGKLFAGAVLDILGDSQISDTSIIAIGSHGQTVLHLPDAETPRTLQIGDPEIIATTTGITTVADFRSADMAAGGQGAPLAPGFHADCLFDENKNRVVLNLGGMANITVLEKGCITGFDTGPGNALLDDWVQKNRDSSFDSDGEWAASGTVDEKLLQALLEYSFFHRPPPKSTGRDEFNLEWLQNFVTGHDTGLKPADVQATLLQLSAQTIATAILDYAPATEEVLLCGGGIHNPVLVSALKNSLPEINLCSTAVLGVDPDAVEAIAFAWLAKQRIENKPGNIPSVTGANKEVLLGAVYAP